MRRRAPHARAVQMKLAAALLALVGFGWSRPTLAATRLELGADYWLVQRSSFRATLALEGRVGRRVSIGGRFGAALMPPELWAIPLDLRIRGKVDRVYLEGLVGPWIFLGGPTVRPHAAFGFGLDAGFISVGGELGWLQPSAIVGLNIGLAL